MLWIDHDTVAISRKEQIEPVDLNHCLKAFTSEEKLEQWYHCSHCKGKKPATKKLQIWKLPPILIIHLKRFNCVNNKWVKSQKVVHFPFDNFDPTPYLAAVPQETILRHKELLEMNEISQTLAEISEKDDNNSTLKDKALRTQATIRTTTSSPSNGNTNINNTPTNSSTNTTTTTTISKNKPLNGLNKEAQLSLNDQVNNLLNLQSHTQILDNCKNIVVDTKTITNNLSNSTNNDNSIQMDGIDLEDDDEESSDRILDNTMIMETSLRNNDGDRTMTRRKRLISTSLTKSPIIDGEFEDYHQHKLKNGEDKFDPKYKLYAVVSHSGMLNGGHYVSYAANPNGSWYCYNDSSCREISSRPNIDPSSAYLLFYERKGLDYEPYLPNIEGKTIPNGGLGALENDETENDLKKMCTIT